MTNIQQTGDGRAELETWLAYLLNLLRWIDARWQEKTSIAQRHQPLILLKKKWGFLPFALWVVGLVVLLTVIGTPILQAWAKAEAYAQGSIRYPNIQAPNVGILMIPVALIIAVAIVLVRNKLVLPRLHAHAERINQPRRAHNQALLVEEQQLDVQLNQASHDFAANIGDKFPKAYLYDEAVGFCVQMVRNHRATSIPEAINLYETERHHQRVENLLAWQAAEAQRTRKLAAVGNVVQAAMQGAVIGTIRQEGAQTRAALRKPVNIKVR
jgi:hypothetical protein